MLTPSEMYLVCFCTCVFYGNLLWFVSSGALLNNGLLVIGVFVLSELLLCSATTLKEFEIVS